MSKSNATENDLVKFIANATAFPSYGATLYMHLHTADPGEAGTSSSSEASYTDYARIAVSRDVTGGRSVTLTAHPTPRARRSRTLPR
jgi:hypothetical protein